MAKAQAIDLTIDPSTIYLTQPVDVREAHGRLADVVRATQLAHTDSLPRASKSKPPQGLLKEVKEVSDRQGNVDGVHALLAGGHDRAPDS